ncbi:hypothetical protein [Rhizobacter sp. P5_C2]
MKKRSARLVKKLHRRWIPECAIDASQSACWRTRLFDSKAGAVFELSRANLAGLSGHAGTAIQKLGLRFSVTVSDSEGEDLWLRENGAVVFKFWATDFPEVCFYSGNNPAIR